MKVARERVIGFNFIIKDSLGNELENSEGKPTYYVQGIGAHLPIIEKALEGQEVGYKTTIHLTADDAFGDFNTNLVINVPLSEFEDEDIAIGMEFSNDEESNEGLIWRLTKITDNEVTLDANHPYAGKELYFFLEITEIREATADELDSGLVVV
jgi:FKBP-type peptidyl-prolyl cis-trans isomerase SlyD